jgi:hypothetical protein
MMNTQKTCGGVKAEKFQRLLLGILLFISYFFLYYPIVYFVAFIILISALFGSKYTPFFQFYQKIIEPKVNSSSSNALSCADNSGANKFACSLGIICLITSMSFFYLGKETVAWILVVIVGVLSVLAGTVGFCLGTALYAVLFTKKG